MRHDRNNNRDERNRNRDEEPRWLHEQRHGHNSDRGNYTIDSNFNLGYGGAADKDYGDQRTFNTNADQGYTYPQGRYQVGGAQYSGDDYTRNSRSSEDNPYGVTYVPQDRHNSYRHYEANADYSNKDYDDLRRKGRSHERYGMADERFGHDVRHGRDRQNEYMGHSSPGDYESYRRYEYGNRMYDNDYSGGFAGRNHTEGKPHFGEDTYYSNLERWQGQSNQRHDRTDRDRARRS
ncbi:hypothetical protein [Pontibacter ruber]|uniref:SWFGD domain-containing protein n=1 Tax=Pontibacter ruber TaxID=1343895 RepID=A0ABW5CS00_9BACT|nr:hypothetical protein [Pontibacter ruber]